jgi:hypothetical protein
MPTFKIFITISLLASVAQLPPFELNPVFSAGEILSPEQLRSEDHVVTDQVSNDGFMNHFVVETPYGEFSAEGDLQLLASFAA